MANMFSFFKYFRRNKGEVRPQKSTKQSPSGTKPKQIIETEFKRKENSSFQSKTPLNRKEKDCDLKASNSQSIRKLSKEEKERRIELVGNYLMKESRQWSHVIPLRPKRNPSKSANKGNQTSETLIKSQMNLEDRCDTRELVLTKSHLNSSLDSIIEMNVNPIITKRSEKLLNTGNGFNAFKSEVDTKCETNLYERQPKEPKNTKSDFDLVDTDWSHYTEYCYTSPHKRYDNSKSKSKVNSGLVYVKDIDLKTAKCGVCLRLVSKNINITVCSHIFCASCLQRWLKYSQHCPECRSFVSSFGYSIRTRSDRICIRSEKDYKVKRIARIEDNFVDSLGAAYLFEAFLSNRQNSKYLNSNIAKICAKISDLESKLSANGRDVQMNVNIRYRITEENLKLEEMKQKKRISEESYKDICNETNPHLMLFWRQVLPLRENSILN